MHENILTLFWFWLRFIYYLSWFLVPFEMGFFIMIPWSALMTRAFAISIKAAVWIRTRHLPLLVQWPVFSTKGKMQSFCAKNFWCKTLTKQDYEPGDQRLSMYLLISNSENYYWFFGLIVKSAFYWCMKIYWLCFDFGSGLFITFLGL